jgi:hypothetical protein
MITAEHGYTGLSRATGETHIWMTDPPGPTGDCGHLHCRPAVDNRIDSLVRQLSNSGVRPAATDSQAAAQTVNDRDLIDRRDELARLFRDGPLNQLSPDVESIDKVINAAEAMVERHGSSRARAALDQRMQERDEAVDAMVQRKRWIGDHAHQFDEYTEIRREIDRRVAARTVLWRINPPEDLLAQIGSRSESPDPQAWDAAVAVYARTRLDVGPDVDLLDPAVRQAAQWRDIVLQPIETPAPTLRLTV